VLGEKELFASRSCTTSSWYAKSCATCRPTPTQLQRGRAARAAPTVFQRARARRQLDTAIDWGRYAELFAYDDDSGELYLEEEQVTESPHEGSRRHVTWLIAPRRRYAAPLQ